MRKLIFGMILISSSAFAGTQELSDCLKDYAQNQVEEYNLPNESLISSSPAAVNGTIKALSSTWNRVNIKKSSEVLKQAQAVGLVIQYSDEVQLMYFGVSEKNGQCQVQMVGEISTADIEGSNMNMKPNDAPLLFLGKTKSQLQELLGADSTIGDIFDGVVESLSY